MASYKVLKFGKLFILIVVFSRFGIPSNLSILEKCLILNIVFVFHQTKHLYKALMCVELWVYSVKNYSEGYEGGSQYLRTYNLKL